MKLWQKLPGVLSVLLSVLMFSSIGPSHSVHPQQGALCSEVNRLCCRSRFGDGYLLEVHVPDNGAIIADAQQFVQRELRGHEAEAPVFGRLRFQLPAQGLKLSQVLRAMEGRKIDLNVIAYALSQPTLEQVSQFLTFVRCGDSLWQSSFLTTLSCHVSHGLLRVRKVSTQNP